jgi:hypothetical protein
MSFQNAAAAGKAAAIIDGPGPAAPQQIVNVGSKPTWIKE